MQKIKNFCLFCFLILGSTFIMSAQCTGDIILTTQAEVDAFPANNCSIIEGNLTIDGADITNLDSLVYLTLVEGAYFTIQNTSVENLNGLENANVFKTTLELKQNPNLISIAAITNMSSHTFNVDFHATNNDALLSIPSLPNYHANFTLIAHNNALQDISLTLSGYDDFEIFDNPSLISFYLDGDNLTDNAKIYDNENLTTIDIDSISFGDVYFDIYNNPNLLSISCTGESDEGSLRIYENEKLEDIAINITGEFQTLKVHNNNMLSNLGNIEIHELRDLIIYDNPILENIEGLNIYDLWVKVEITGNPLLQICCPISFDDANPNYITISNNGVGCSSLQELAQNCDNIDLCDFELSITLSSQAEVDAFNCNNVKRDLLIEGLDITNLDSLITLTEIDRDLIIQNTSLVDLSGLENLHTVESLIIQSNPNLENIEHIANVSSNNWNDFDIAGNDALLSIPDFPNWSHTSTYHIASNNALQEVLFVPSYIYSFAIYGNPSLTNFSSNQSLISGIIYIYDNYNLMNINLDVDLTDVYLKIYDNPNLANLSCVGNSNQSYIDINNNAQLENITIDMSGDSYALEIDNNDALSNLEDIKFDNLSYLSIRFNDILENIEGLIITNNIGDLEIINNPLLEECCLDFFDAVEGEITIYNNNDGCNSIQEIAQNCDDISLCDLQEEIFLLSQADIDAFPTVYGCEIIPSTLIIQGSDITNLLGLSGVTGIEGDVFINDNILLENLEGLNNLTYINNDLHFNDNFILENVDALSNLTNVYSITFEGGHNALTNVDGFSNITSLNNYIDLSGGMLALDNLNGFSNITSIGSQLEITNLQSITNLDAFANLTTIGYNLSITDCDNLENIGGLVNLNTVEGVSITNNVSLSNCCSVPSWIANAEWVVIENNADGCNDLINIQENCDGTSGNGFIAAFIFYDVNANGVFDVGDYSLDNQSTNISPNPLEIYSSAEGTQVYLVENNASYELTWVENGLWTTTNPSYTVNPETDATVQYNFPLVPATDVILLDTDLSSDATRCGFEVNFWLSYENNGTNVANGLIQYQPDELVSLVNADPAPDYEEDGILYWNYEELIPSEQRQIYMNFQMPGVENIGDPIESEGFIYALDENEDTIAQSKFTHSSEITCAYDPNDKLVKPEGLGSQNYSLLTDSLYEYTIRFQNTGNDTAFNVSIEDYLDSDFDWNSFDVVSSSHEVRTVLETETGLVTFFFDDIYLPDSNINEPLSHGFVKYEILLKENLDNNATVENTANIYFDFNPAIVTNTTTNTLVENYPILIANVDLKVFLEGAYQPDMETMKTDLQDLNILPLSQPYNVAPYDYQGLEGVETASDLPENIVDWVLVEARSGTPNLIEASTTIIEINAGFLLSDGSVVGKDGNPMVFRSLEYGMPYHFVVRHRNHLDIISKEAIIASDQMTYDFTTNIDQAFGTYQQKELANGKAALYVGDYIKDGILQITDYDAWKEYPAQNNIYGSTDGTLDGIIQNTDADAWRPNKAKIGIIEIRF